MKNLKDKRKKILILILIFIIILCVLFKIAQDKNLNFQEDLIFFKLFDIGNIQENNQKENLNKENTYKVKVVKGQSSYQKVDLLQSIDMKNLINRKISPGTKGSFYVYLTSNANMNYEIEIVDKNKSPENFEFEISEKQGKIEKNKIKKIEINWKWPYELGKEENAQDTKDGININEYDFEICTIGK